ncbi:MAG: phage tail sheath family protein [Cypionkella sp.]
MFDTPGVYVREIPSGVRAISGVATSNTAFVGVFGRGPVNAATRVTSFGEFERTFGGLSAISESSYGVRNYFLNGGSVAFIVRVTAGVAAAASVDIPGNAGLVLDAAFTGTRGNALRVGIAHGGAGSVTFDMLVREYDALGAVVNEEQFPALSINSPGAAYVTTALAASALVHVTSHTSGDLPSQTALTAGGLAANLAELLATPATDLAPLAGGSAAPAAATAALPGGAGLDLAASSQGAWGNALRVGIAHSGGGTTFDMLVREYQGTEVVREEAFTGLSITAGQARYVSTVIDAESELVDVTAHTSGDLPSRTALPGGTFAADINALMSAPSVNLTAFTNGADGTVPGNTDAWRDAAIAAIGGSEANQTGIFALDTIVPDVFNLLCLPDLCVLDQGRMGNAATVYQAAHAYCTRNFAFLVVDVPEGTTRANVLAWTGALGGTVRRNAALYYPKMRGPDPLNPAMERTMATSGAVAGIYARTDASRGVWKAPAGTAAGLAGGRPIDVMTNLQQGPLNVQGINVLRTFPVYNSVIWGARTLDGADALASEWRYIPVRRLALFIEDSLQRGLQWVVFEPNDEPLWASVRLNVTAFMSQLHRQGAFQGASARDAFLVKCDSETTTQADINLGILNIYVGFAPVRPAEFVVLRIQQRIQTNA